MAVDVRPVAPAGSALDALEGVAWRIPLSTRRLFLALTLGVVAAILLSSLAAAWVAARNTDTISRARDTGLEIASAATEFRTNLAAADAQAASTLISGGLEDPSTRSRYDDAMLDASQALTDASLAATDDDREDIQALSDGLVRYAGLVETSRANSRQGFPVGATYLNQARALARDELGPTADHLRREGERRVAQAANSVGGPIGGLAVVVLVLALIVLVAAAAVAAGRSRRLTHPALLAATIASIAALIFVTVGILAQSRELRAAASTDIDAYIAANDAALTVSNMRVTEIAAVAAHGSGDPLYQDVDDSANDLVTELSGTPLGLAVQNYANAVTTVRSIDLEDGDNRAAALNTLGDVPDDQQETSSAARFEAANQAATDEVGNAFGALSDRFDAASDARINPLIPIALGIVAAALAAAGTLARARRYR